MVLNTKVEFIKGVGPKRAEVLRKELGIFTYSDLIYYYPYRYVDKSQYLKINQIDSTDVHIQVIGRLANKEKIGQGRASRISATLTDETGAIELVFFKGLKWINDNLEVGQTYVVFGKPSVFKGRYNFTHPEFETLAHHNSQGGETFSPMYNTTEKMKTSYLNTKAISNIIKALLTQVQNKIKETLPQYILKEFGLIGREEALTQIHFPTSPKDLEKAKLRLKFEELFLMQLEHQVMKKIRVERSKGFSFGIIGDKFNDFYNNYLPFSLTKAQQRVIREIRNDMKTGHQMNRLLQGDVGSGKTLVALFSMLIALDNGYQAAMIAPTEILAQQHLVSIQNFLGDMPVRVELLTGSTKQKDRRIILPDLEEGKIDIIIGTHAIFEDTVVFNNLGLCIIDEQHRFGVEQRAKMWTKNNIPPHVLVMTATPIPRTLAMTVYGDLDSSVIDELPPGRKPVHTSHYYDNARLRLYHFIREQIKEGRQIYIVYPLIQESEKLDLKDLMDGYESVVREFPLPEYQISIVHGQLKSDVKDYEMDRFKRGITHIMVSTTVIEVGVDVPNASVMVIENAERFGLSQLHQLRGRVGRGADQSYCILMTSYKLSAEARVRIDTMCRTNDGFEIAEADLKLRGPGDIAGTRQSGILELRIADIVKDEQILRLSRDLAIRIVGEDPSLSRAEHRGLREYVETKKSKMNYSKIS